MMNLEAQPAARRRGRQGKSSGVRRISNVRGRGDTMSALMNMDWGGNLNRTPMDVRGGTAKERRSSSTSEKAEWLYSWTARVGRWATQELRSPERGEDEAVISTALLKSKGGNTYGAYRRGGATWGRHLSGRGMAQGAHDSKGCTKDRGGPAQERRSGRTEGGDGAENGRRRSSRTAQERRSSSIHRRRPHDVREWLGGEAGGEKHPKERRMAGKGKEVREGLVFSGVIQKASGPKTVRIRQKREKRERVDISGRRENREIWYKVKHRGEEMERDRRGTWNEGREEGVEGVETERKTKTGVGTSLNWTPESETGGRQGEVSSTVRRRRKAREKWRRWRRWKRRCDGHNENKRRGLSARSPEWVPSRLRSGREERGKWRAKRWKAARLLAQHARGADEHEATKNGDEEAKEGKVLDETLTGGDGGRDRGQVEAWAEQCQGTDGPWRSTTEGLFSREEVAAATAMMERAKLGGPYKRLKIPGRRTLELNMQVMRSLLSGRPLKGDIVAAIGMLIEEASEGELVVADNHTSTLWDMGDTTWLVKLMERLQEAEERSRRRGGEASRLLIPWYLAPDDPTGIGHTVTAIVDRKKANIIYCDTLAKDKCRQRSWGSTAHTNKNAQDIRRCMQKMDELEGRAVRQWTMNWGRARHQGRTLNCSVHSLLAMRQCLEGGEPTGEKACMRELRLHMLLEIMEGKLRDGRVPRGTSLDLGNERRGTQGGMGREGNAEKRGNNMVELKACKTPVNARPTRRKVTQKRKSVKKSKQQRKTAVKGRGWKCKTPANARPTRRKFTQKAKVVKKSRQQRKTAAKGRGGKRKQKPPPTKQLIKTRRKRAATGGEGHGGARSNNGGKNARDAGVRGAHDGEGINKGKRTLTTGDYDRDILHTSWRGHGQDVHWTKQGHNFEGRIRAATWNGQNMQMGKGGIRGEKLEYLLNEVGGAGQVTGELERTPFDFLALQETGWPSDMHKKLWVQRTRADGQGKKGDATTTWQDTGWRRYGNDKVALLWRQKWEDRRWGRPVLSEDGRTVGAVFSTRNGKVGVINHWGHPAPQSSESESKWASSLTQALTIVSKMKEKCSLVLLLGDLNTQRRKDRLGVEGEEAAGGKAGGADAAERLWRHTMSRGAFVDPLNEMGYTGVWTRRQSPEMPRTRPDWTLVWADFEKWRIRRAGIRLDTLQDGEGTSYSDHRPVMVELESMRGEHGVGKLRRRRPEGWFNATNPTAEEEEQWTQRVEKIAMVTPTMENWEETGRFVYGKLMRSMQEVAREVFKRKGARGQRPWWDREAGKTRAAMRALIKIRRQTDKGNRNLTAAEKNRARRNKRLPMNFSLEGSGAELAERANEAIADMVKSLRYRARRRRIWRKHQHDSKMDWKRVVTRALGRYNDDKDPYAAVVQVEEGVQLTTNHEVVKEEAREVAARWFTSIKNHRVVEVVWDKTVEPREKKAVHMEMVQRKGYERWRRDKMAMKAAEAIGETDGIPSCRGDRWTVSHSDCVWLQKKQAIRGLQHVASPFTVWFRKRCTRSQADRVVALAQEHDGYQIVFIDEYRRTAMGWMRSMWMSRMQRQKMANREEVMAAMPLTSEVFFDNKVIHTSGMPEEMVKVWGLKETREKALQDNDGFGQYVCPEKRRKFMKLMEREAFWEIFKKAITLVKGKAAAGHDFLTARLFRTLTEKTRKSLAEYMRIAILKQDLSKEMMETILKWLPKDGRKSTYINNTTTDAPNLRPIGLNTAASKILEYVLFLVQIKISPGEERVHSWMFAWHRGKYVYTAALIHELITEDSTINGKQLFMTSMDAMHWFDTVHSETMIMCERRLGYPIQLISAKAAVMAGAIRVRTYYGRSRPYPPQQGLGQGRVGAPTSSNINDNAVATAMPEHDPYVIGEGRYRTKVSRIHYADDRNGYSSTAAGIRKHVQGFTTVQLGGGGAFRADKCWERRSDGSGLSAVGEINDPTCGGMKTIPVVPREETKRFLGFYGNMNLTSTRGAELLEEDNMRDLRKLRKRSVMAHEFLYIISAVLGGRTRAKCSLSKGMREATRKMDIAISMMALNKLGERSTNSRHFLYMKDHLGEGLVSLQDIWVQNTITGVLRELRKPMEADTRRIVEWSGIQHANRWGLTLPWGRCKKINRGSKAMDDTVAERVEAALAEVGFHFHRKEEWSRKVRATDGCMADDGGRTMDWRISDLLRESDQPANKRWRRRYNLVWLGQIMDRGGKKLLSTAKWRDMGDNQTMKETTHKLLSTIIDEHGIETSPRMRMAGGLVTRLNVGQFALVNEIQEIDGGVEVGRRAILVQGIDRLGGNGDKRCQACRANNCSLHNHEAMVPREVDGHNMLRVREWVRQEMTAEGAGLKGVYVNRGKSKTIDVHMTGPLLVVEPRVVRRHDGVYATVWTEESTLVERLILPREGAAVSGGTGITAKQWEDHTQVVTEAWKSKEHRESNLQDGGNNGQRGVGGRKKRKGEDYSTKWDDWMGQDDKTWLYRWEGEGRRTLEDITFSTWPERHCTILTDGSAGGRGTGGAMYMRDTGEVVMVKMSGRQEDVHSYAAEMMMLIMIVTAIPDNMVVTWIGDNESVVDHYRDNEWLGEMLNTPEAEGWPNRSLKVWLLKAIKRLHARGSKLEAIHQRSHLSLRGPSSDHRVALDVVDRAAGRAHAMAKHHVNLSGWNEGCADWELFDSKGWRVDGKEGGAIMQKLQQLHKDRWRNVEKQGRQIREGRLTAETSRWARGRRPTKLRRFASRLMRGTLATEEDRQHWDINNSGACRICKWGSPTLFKGRRLECLVVEGEGRRWRVGKVVEQTETEGEWTIERQGKTEVMHTSQLRTGLWRLHTVRHVLGEDGMGASSPDIERMLRESCERQIKNALRRIRQRSENPEPTSHWEPYAAAAAAMMSAAGDTQVFASEVTIFQLQLMQWVAREMINRMDNVVENEELLSRALRNEHLGTLSQEGEEEEALGQEAESEGEHLHGIGKELSEVAEKIMDEASYNKGWWEQRLPELREDCVPISSGSSISKWKQTAERHPIQCHGDVSRIGIQATIGITLLRMTKGEVSKHPNCEKLMDGVREGWALTEGPEYTVGRTPKGQEPKKATSKEIWSHNGWKLHDEQMRVWWVVIQRIVDVSGSRWISARKGVGNNPEIEEERGGRQREVAFRMVNAWSKLPRRASKTTLYCMREEMVQAIMWLGHVDTLAGVSVWCPYSMNVGKLGPQASEELGIRRGGLEQGDGTTVLVRRATLGDLRKARGRRGLTILLWQGQRPELYPQEKVMFTMKKNTYCPEWRNGCLGIKKRRVDYSNTVGAEVSMISIGKTSWTDEENAQAWRDYASALTTKGVSALEGTDTSEGSPRLDFGVATTTLNGATWEHFGVLNTDSRRKLRENRVGRDMMNYAGGKCMEAVMALHQQKWSEERQLAEDLSYAWGLPNSYGKTNVGRDRRKKRRSTRRQHRKGPLGYLRATKAQRRKDLQKMADLLAKTPRKQTEADTSEYGGVIHLVGQDSARVQQTLAERMQGLHRDEGGQGEETTLRAVGSEIDDRQLKEIGVTTPGLKYAFLSRCQALGDAGLQGFLRVRGDSLRRIVLYGLEWKISKATRQMAKDCGVELLEQRTGSGRRSAGRVKESRPSDSSATEILGKPTLMGRSVLSPFGGELELEDRWYVGRVEKCLGLRGGERCYRVEYEDGENVVRTEQQVLEELVPGVPDGHTWQGSMTAGEKRVLLRRASRGLQVDLAQVTGGTTLVGNTGKKDNDSTKGRRRAAPACGSATESEGPWGARHDSGGNSSRWLLELIEMNKNRESRKNMLHTSSRKVDRRGMSLSSEEAKRRQEELQNEREEMIAARMQKQEWAKRKKERRRTERMIELERRENRRLQQNEKRQEELDKARRSREQRKERRWRPGEGEGARRQQHDADDNDDDKDDDEEDEDCNEVDEGAGDGDENDDDNDAGEEDGQKHKVPNRLGEVE